MATPGIDADAQEAAEAAEAVARTDAKLTDLEASLASWEAKRSEWLQAERGHVASMQRARLKFLALGAFSAAGWAHSFSATTSNFEHIGRGVRYLASSQLGLILIGVSATLVGLLAFAMREKHRYLYGVIETGVGISAVIWGARAEANIQAGAAFVAGVYAIVRGIDNASHEIMRITESLRWARDRRAESNANFKSVSEQVVAARAQLEKARTQLRAAQAVLAAKVKG